MSFGDDTLRPDLTYPKPGLYRHYKGMNYRVIAVARHSEAPESALVVYQALYGEQELWVRPRDMFVEHVVIDGKSQPRFERVGD